MPFFKPFYRIVSAVAVAAVAAVGQPAAASLAHAASDTVANRLPERPLDQIVPGDCLAATWSPPDARLFTVPPGGPTALSVAVAAPVALNASTVQYQLYNPGSGYTGWIAITNYVQVDSRTIVMTATNVQPVSPVNNTFQSIQFKVNPVVGSQVACSPVHTIFAVTSRARLPIAIKNFAVTNIAPVGYANDPNKPYYNNDICRAVPIWPGATYTARFAEQENFFQITTLATSTLTVTVGGFTTDGQIQLRRSDGTCGTGVAFTPPIFQSTPGNTRVLAVNNIAPGKSYLRVVSSDDLANNRAFQMNVVFGPPQTNVGPYEPNNTACTAYPIAPNVSYQAYPDDSSDWYSFTLATPLNVQLSITNFVVSGAGQYILYKSGNCSSLGTPVTIQDKSASTYGPVALGAGLYFLRVAVASGFQNTQLYTLRVNTSAASAWNPQFERCSGLSNCTGLFTNNRLTVYWTGAPNMNLLRMRLGSRGAVGSCPATTTFEQIVAGSSVYAATGNWEVLNVPSGSYDLSVFTTSSLGEQYASPTFQVYINCDPSGAVVWSPKFDLCAQLSGCSPNFTNNRLKVYWTGTPNMNLLRMRLGGRTAGGSCPATTTIEQIVAGSSVWASAGSWEVLNIPSGSYDMSLYTTSSTGQQHATQVFKVNVNCTGLTGANIQTGEDTAGEDKGDEADTFDPNNLAISKPQPTAIPEPTAIP